MSESQIPLGEYIFLRVNQYVNQRSIFGIPGDFNLNLLEHLYSPSLENTTFIGLCNELNASYTADGYARINGLSVLITTFGVGELSAINGISGSFAEYVPVLHIVGTSSLKQKNAASTTSAFDNSSVAQFTNLHHLIQNKNTLSPPDHYVYEKMITPISVVQESLSSLSDAPNQVNNVIKTILKHSRPGYLFIPSDMPDMLVPSSLLDEPLWDLKNDPKNEDFLTDLCLDGLYDSVNPGCLVDIHVNHIVQSDEPKSTIFCQSEYKDADISSATLTESSDDTKEITSSIIKPKTSRLLSKLLQLPLSFYSTNLSKSIISENHPNYIGCYFGSLSPFSNDSLESIKKSFESLDFVLWLGSLNAETNTTSFNFKNTKTLIELSLDYFRITTSSVALISKCKKYGMVEATPNCFFLRDGFNMDDVISKFLGKVESNRISETTIDFRYAPRLFSNDALPNAIDSATPDISSITRNSSVDSNILSYQNSQRSSISSINSFMPPQTPLTQNNLMDILNHSLQPNDILILETCSFIFAIPDLKFPAGVRYISQGFYGSIGYALPATLGVCLAQRDLYKNTGEKPGRVILIEGDGSAQMTIQELASYLRYEITPTILLLNNSGYTVERIIKGPTRSYNDVAPDWKWCDLFNVMGDTKGQSYNLKIDSKEQMEQFMSGDPNRSPNVITGDKLGMIELILGKMDAPGRFDYICGKKDPRTIK